jgi:hypothetical protein
VTFDDQQQRNDDRRKTPPPNYAAEIAMLWASLKDTWLTEAGRANTVARIAYLGGTQ